MIGWYVHHHGHGHVTRFLAIQPHLRGPVTVFSSLPRPAALGADAEWVTLPFDADPEAAPDGTMRDPADADPTAGGLLHWAPVGHDGHRARLATIAAWVASSGATTFVVDVSAEVAVFVRLLGVRTVVVTQPGERTDPAHALAYDLADVIVAPWAEGTIDATALAGRTRVAYVGGISRYAGRDRSTPRETRRVLFLGRTFPAGPLGDAVRALREEGWQVDVAGAVDGDARVDDIWPMLCRSSVVVTAAGQNSIADVAAAEVPAVVVPQTRPFDEQAETAGTLARLGLAVTAPADASASDIVRLVRDARPADWSAWRVAGAAERAAGVIEGGRR